MKSVINKEVLEELYINQRLDIATTGKHLGIAYGTTHYYLRKFDIPRRTTRECLKGVKKSESHRKNLSEAKKGNKHPSFGKKCSVHGKRCYWKTPCGDVVSLRSSWEAAYAEHLDKKNIHWRYEAGTFVTEIGAYTPDFYLTETNQYIEIKGWMHDKHRVRIEQFRKEYPEVKLVVLMKQDLLDLGLDLNKEYPGLEKPKKPCLNCGIEFRSHDKSSKFCCKSCASTMVKQPGWKPTLQMPKRAYQGHQGGSNNNGSKLLESDVLEIIDMRKQGVTLLEIAAKKHTSIGNVCNIIKGRSWKHIPR